MTQRSSPILLDITDELVGERVLLHAWRDIDAPDLWAAVDGARAHLFVWMPWVAEHNSAEFSRIYVRRMQAEWILRENLAMAIRDRESGALVGATGLHRFDWTVPQAEIGYWLTPSAVGKGYVTEAVRLLKHFAFEQLGLARIEIRCDAHNTRSAAIPPRAGFVLEATLRCARRSHAGDLADTCIFAALHP